MLLACVLYLTGKSTTSIESGSGVATITRFAAGRGALPEFHIRHF